MCVCVCVCVLFWSPPNNFLTIYPIDTKFRLHIALLILQASSHFTYVTVHSDSPSFPSLHLRHSSFSNPSVALLTSQLILKPFHCFTEVTDDSPTLPSLYLRHSSFSNPYVASPRSQLILQLFRRFTYATAHSPTLLSLLLSHRLFTYVTWRAAHGRRCC